MRGMIMLPRLLVCVLSLALSPALFAAAFHVAPSGSDTNPGSELKPFATVAQAQRAVRELNQRAHGSEPISVVLQGGMYALSDTLVFGPEDSGTAQASVTWSAAPGERPVLTGGRRIAGWKKAGEKMWTAELPEVKAGRWHFNQLYVNGQLRTRARIPNQGFLRVAGCPEGTPKTVNYHKDCQSFQFKPGDIRPDWTNLRDVEVIVYHFWTDSHLPIRSVDTTSNIVTFAHKAGKVFTDDFTENGARYIVENVFEGLDAPGEWYLNRRTGVLYYIPMPGEQMESADVQAPRLTAFMRLQGNARERQFVEHLILCGLTFEYSSFELPAGNSNDRQGSASVPAAVTMTGARYCAFERCAFRNLGTWAIEAGPGCSENRFTANDIGPIAAGAFRINGGTERDHPLERTANNLITDNHIYDYGQVYPSAVGILVMITEGNTVAHNHIHHGFYTGVSVGWVWGYGRSISQGNRIEYNHIHDIGQGLLSDMGGIYTLGVSPGTVVRNNLIHDVDANQYGGWGIYHDEGSTHLLVENNIVYRTKFAPFNIHYAKEVTVRNNVFALGRLEQLSRTRMEPHKSVFLENNIVYWKTGELFSKNWKDEAYSLYTNPKNKGGTSFTSTFECDWNLYFNPGEKLDEVKFAGGNWPEWQKRGKDVHSLYSDPLFMDPDNGDFRLKTDSPALRLGFKPIDMSSVGPRGATGP